MQLAEQPVGELVADPGASRGLHASPRRVGGGERIPPGHRDRDEPLPAVIAGARRDEAARLEHGEVARDRRALGFDPLPYYREGPADPEYPLELIMGVREDEYFHSAGRNVPSLRRRRHCRPESFGFPTAGGSRSNPAASTRSRARGDTSTRCCALTMTTSWTVSKGIPHLKGIPCRVRSL